MFKYKKFGEKMAIADVLCEMFDMLLNDFEGEEVANCYNNIMMDQIEYVSEDDEFRKIKSHDDDVRH